MDWLNQSFAQHTLAWLFLSSVVGGVVGSAIKFGFEDVLRPIVGDRRQTRLVTTKYTVPIVRAAESLERRINNFVRNRNKQWYADSKYYRLSTLYTFAEYFAWVRLIERHFGYLPFESVKKAKEFNRHIHGTLGSLTGFKYFSWAQDEDIVEQSAINRHMLTAIGEVSLNESGDKPLDFTNFAIAYSNEPQFRSWFRDLDSLLSRAERVQTAHASRGDAYCLDRLIATGGTLRGLIVSLDPRHRLAPKRSIVNLDQLQDRRVGESLGDDFPELVNWNHLPPAMTPVI